MRKTYNDHVVERETWSSRKQKNNIPNAEQLVDRFIKGDQDAFEVLDGHLRPNLRGYFLSHLPDFADDLTQETFIELLPTLHKFKEEHSGEENFSRNLVFWSFGIARNVLKGEWSRRYRQNISTVKRSTDEDLDMTDDVFLSWVALKNGQSLPSAEDEVIMQHEESEQESKRQQLMLELREKIAEILPPYQRRVIELMLDGKTRIEIANELECSENTTKIYASLARSKIEKELLFPAGWKRVAGFGSHIKTAVNKKRIPAFEFLGILYTMQANVQRYEDTKSIIDNDLLENGYFVLSAVTTKQEMWQIKTKNRGLLRLHKDIWYISQKNLEQFRQSQPNHDQDPGIQEDSRYKLISQLSKTQKEYDQLYGAAKRGKLRSVKQGRNWFTTQEEVDKFREQNEFQVKSKK